MRIAACSAALLCLASAELRAQPSIFDALPPGRVSDSLVSRADAAQRYAVYLPSAYDASRKWPVLVLMDPRGRAHIPLDRFRAAAERLGYIIVSSYNTLSDGPREPNYRAVDAILDDVPKALSVNPRRFYLAGFSGTARAAWEMSEPYAGTVAGIIGYGAALPGDLTWLHRHVHGGATGPIFDVALSVGTLDPNYEIVRGLDRELATIALRRRFEIFDGEHSWPPDSVCVRSLEWLEAMALVRGTAERIPARVAWEDSLAAAWVSSAHVMESRGAWSDARRAWIAMTAFAPLAASAANGDALASAARVATERLAALDQNGEAKRMLAREDAATRRDADYEHTLGDLLTELRTAPAPPSLKDALKRLDIDALKRDAGRTPVTPDDSLAIRNARRHLDRIFVHTSFYEPRDYLITHKAPHAILALRIADTISPGNAFVCLSLARAYAQAGDAAQAVARLDCAETDTRLGAKALADDPLLAPIASDERFKAAIAKLAATRP